jgi:DNA-binding GntR family transcriptional regulator
MAAPKTAQNNHKKELEFLRTQSLASVVQHEIERMILSNELSAGEPVNENMLAARLSISRGPIREACRKLEQAGLLQIHVNRGMFVRELDVAEVLHLYEIRACLSELAGKLLAKRLSAETGRHLSDLVDRMGDAIKANGLETYYPLNLEFHKALMDGAGNPRLAAIYSGMDKELHLFRRHSLDSIPELMESNTEHRAIVDALSAGDAERAGQAMKEHIFGGRRRLLRSIGQTDHHENKEAAQKKGGTVTPRGRRSRRNRNQYQQWEFLQ